jgi:RNA-dependent RNA polymerase
MTLAEMHSQAVDYPKNGRGLNSRTCFSSPLTRSNQTGVPVDIQKLPRNYIPFTPDWKKTELDSPRENDYYRSTRALGELFRAIEIEDPFIQISSPITGQSNLNRPLSDNISQALMPTINRLISSVTDSDEQEIPIRFEEFSDELRYISCTHTLSESGGIHLREEEIFIGAIVSYTTDRRLRRNRTYNMREHAGAVVSEVKRFLLSNPEEPQLEDLKRSWKAWEFSLIKQDQFGASTFGLLALNAIFECLDKVGALDNQLYVSKIAFFNC